MIYLLVVHKLQVVILTIMLIDAIVTAIMVQPHPMLLWGFQYLLVLDTVLMNDFKRYERHTSECCWLMQQTYLMQ